MAKRLVVFAALFFLIATLCYAQERVHTYRGFPMYPPGRSYSFERQRLGSFTVRLFPQEDLSDVTPDKIAAFKGEIGQAAAYIENNAVGAGWQLVQKKEDSDTGSYSFIFTKESEEGSQQVEVSISAGKALTDNEKTRLPDDFGSITYAFKGLGESLPSSSY
jgi:hypothetical protein